MKIEWQATLDNQPPCFGRAVIFCFMGITTRLINNADIVRREMEQAVRAGLEAIGQQAESHAKQNVTAAGRVDTGHLRNSIAHEVRTAEDAVYIGTNVSYGKYVEYGTGKYGDFPTGDGWWVYVTGGDGGGGFARKGKRYTFERAKQIVAILRSKGLDAHMTQGMKPTHYLRNAAADHTDEYAGIMEKHIKQQLSK